MPLYEYECQSCGHRLEAIQNLSDDPLTECPKCEGRLEKLISAPAFQFKGSGWYVTDYGKGGGKEKGSGKGDKEGSSKDSGSSDSSKKSDGGKSKSSSSSSSSGDS